APVALETRLVQQCLPVREELVGLAVPRKGYALIVRQPGEPPVVLVVLQPAERTDRAQVEGEGPRVLDLHRGGVVPHDLRIGHDVGDPRLTGQVRERDPQVMAGWYG